MTTEDERVTGEALRLAIDASIRANFPEEQGFLTDWIVLAAVQRLEDEGDRGTTRYTRLTGNQDLPWHRIIGLIEVSLIVANENMDEDETE